MGQCSWSDDSDFGDDYTQLMTPGTHTISISDSVNDGNKQRNVTHNEQGKGMAEVSVNFVWHSISMLTAVWETFCGIHDT